jgi:hypothetical protein
MKHYHKLLIVLLRGWAFNRWAANTRDSVTDSQAVGFVEGAD